MLLLEIAIGINANTIQEPDKNNVNAMQDPTRKKHLLGNFCDNLQRNALSGIPLSYKDLDMWIPVPLYQGSTSRCPTFNLMDHKQRKT